LSFNQPIARAFTSTVYLRHIQKFPEEVGASQGAWGARSWTNMLNWQILTFFCTKFGNSADKLRHPRTVAYSAARNLVVNWEEEKGKTDTGQAVRLLLKAGSQKEW